MTLRWSFIAWQKRQRWCCESWVVYLPHQSQCKSQSSRGNGACATDRSRTFKRTLRTMPPEDTSNASMTSRSRDEECQRWVFNRGETSVGSGATSVVSFSSGLVACGENAAAVSSSSSDAVLLVGENVSNVMQMSKSRGLSRLSSTISSRILHSSYDSTTLFLVGR